MFVVRYLLDDGTRASVSMRARSSIDAVETLQDVFGERLRYASVRPAAR